MTATPTNSCRELHAHKKHLKPEPPNPLNPPHAATPSTPSLNPSNPLKPCKPSKLSKPSKPSTPSNRSTLNHKLELSPWQPLNRRLASAASRRLRLQQASLKGFSKGSMWGLGFRFLRDPYGFYNGVWGLSKKGYKYPH